MEWDHTFPYRFFAFFTRLISLLVIFKVLAAWRSTSEYEIYAFNYVSMNMISRMKFRLNANSNHFKSCSLPLKPLRSPHKIVNKTNDVLATCWYYNYPKCNTKCYPNLNLYFPLRFNSYLINIISYLALRWRCLLILITHRKWKLLLLL